MIQKIKTKLTGNCFEKGRHQGRKEIMSLLMKNVTMRGACILTRLDEREIREILEK